MAKRISDIYPDETGTLYIIEYCDGTTSTLKSLCCDDPTPQPPPAGNPDTNSGTRCDLAYRFAAIFHGSLLNNTVLIPYLDLVAMPFAIQAYMLQYSIPIGYYPDLLAWFIEYKEPIKYVGEYYPFDAPELLNAMYCCLDETQGFTDNFIQCYVGTYSTGTPETDATYRPLVRDFMFIFGKDYRNERVQYTEVTPPTSPSLCGDCEETPVYGCVPDGVAFSKKYTRLDDELQGTLFCYNANAYDPCGTPENGGFNSKNDNKIHVIFSEGFVCVRGIDFNFAGNGLINWLSVDVISIFDGVETLMASNVSVTGRTNCQAGLAKSFSMAFPEGYYSQEIMIRPNRWVGSGGITAPITIHCITIQGSLDAGIPV